MVVDEIDDKILSQAYAINNPSEVSFQKGDTFFVTGYCKLRTMPLRLYLASFGGKQVHDMTKAKYIVVRDFQYETDDTYRFEGGTWWHKESCSYRIEATELRTKYDCYSIERNWENHFGYKWGEKLTKGWLQPEKREKQRKNKATLEWETVTPKEDPTDRITCEYYLANPDKVYIDEDLIQRFVYAYHKEHLWTKLTEEDLRGIIYGLETDDSKTEAGRPTNTNTDMALNAVDQFDPTDIMPYLILAYHSDKCTKYTRKKIKHRILDKDPDIADHSSMADRYSVNGRSFSEDRQHDLLKLYPILKLDHFQKFLDI